jgi:hypothetical protein
LQSVPGGITWQLAAVQQAPPRQAPGAMQLVVQPLPLQRTEAAQEFMPVQAIWFMRASECRPAAHDDGPVQSSSQLLPMQVTRPRQDIEPEQVTVLVAPTACTPSLHEPVPLQLTVQVVPVQRTPVPHAPLAQCTSHDEAPPQSTPPVQVVGPQVTLQGAPVGHLMAPGQERPGPQVKVQVSPTQVPPVAAHTSHGVGV